jgi:O-antigen/teichoic acid export membrane protein
MAQIVDITQGSLVKKLLRHGSLYFIANVIVSFVNLLLIPLDTRLFTPDEYGTIVTITSATRVMVIFIGLYLDSAYNRFYHEYKHDALLLRRHISTLYWFVMGWGALMVMLSLGAVEWIIKPGLPVCPVFVLAFISPLFTQLGMMSQAYLQQNHRSGLQVSVTLANLALNITVMLLAVGMFKAGMVGKFIGIFCGTGLSFLLGAFILVREGYLRFTFSMPMLVESLRFSIPLIPNIAAGWIAGFSDRILLSMYGPLSETGIYNVGYSLGMGFMLFSQSIFMVYGPMIYAMMKQDPETARRRIERFVPYYLMLMLWFCFALSLFAREIVALLTPDQYAGAAAVVPVVLFAYFIGSQYQVAVTLLSFHKKTSIISTGAIIQALLNFGLNLIFVPIFAKMAAAWTTVIAMGFYATWMIYWSQKNFTIQINLRRIGIITAIMFGGGLVFWGINSFIPDLLLLAITFKAGILLCTAIALWTLGGIEATDKAKFKKNICILIAQRLGKAT